MLKVLQGYMFFQSGRNFQFRDDSVVVKRMIVRGQKTFLFMYFLLDSHDMATYDFQGTHDLVLRLLNCLFSLLPLSLSIGPSLDCRILSFFRVHIELSAELTVLFRVNVKVDISSTHHMVLLVFFFKLDKILLQVIELFFIFLLA